MLGAIAAHYVDTPAVGSYFDEVMADSPLAYYRLGEAAGTTMTDSSGNVRHGTYTNGPTLGVTGALAGDSDTAIQLDGSNDYGRHGRASWVPTHLGSWTVEVWAKFTTTGFASLLSVRDITGGSGGITVILTVGRTAGRIGAESWSWETVASRVISDAANNDGLWHHVVATFDRPSSMLSLYIDGTLHDSKVQSGVGFSGDRSVTVGANNDGGIQNFPGSVDELAIYGTSLSAARIATHYEAATT